MLDYLDVHAYFAKLFIQWSAGSNIPVLIRGLPQPDLSNKPDHVRFNLLGGEPQANHNNYMRWMVELVITSWKAQHRSDRSWAAPQLVFKELKPFLYRQSYIIKTTCIRSKEVKITHLDNRTTGQGFAPVSVTSPETETHSLVAIAEFVEISKGG